MYLIVHVYVCVSVHHGRSQKKFQGFKISGDVALNLVVFAYIVLGFFNSKISLGGV